MTQNFIDFLILFPPAYALAYYFYRKGEQAKSQTNIEEDKHYGYSDH